MQHTADYLTFGQWRYLRTIGQLQPLSACAETEVLTLEPRLHKLLNFLLDHKETVLSREQILTGVWGHGAGSDESLSRAIAALRRVLQDNRVEPTYIATLSKKGYCWLAPVAHIEIPPLAIQSHEPQLNESVTLIRTHQAVDSWHKSKRRTLKRIRYIWFSTLVLFICSLGFALLVSKMNEKAALPRYLQVTPVSALDGKEQTPLVSSDHSLVLFQHQRPDESGWSWVVQRLPSMNSQHDEHRYQKLSQPHWLDQDQIIYRSQQGKECSFRRKPVKHHFAESVPLFSCHQFIVAGQAMTADGLYWLDLDPATGQSQLWLWQQENSQRLLMTFPSAWRGVSHLIVKGKKAYAIAQSGYSYSSLIELDLTNLNWLVAENFAFTATQLAWWGEHDLLLNKSANQLQVWSSRTGNRRVFGEMTFNLADSSVWQQSLLAVYPAQAMSDLRRLQWNKQNSQITSFPFAESNRSEFLLLVHQGQHFFVSDRSGLPQLWLAEGQNIEQISQFKTSLAIEQLLWLDGKLVMLVDRQLFEFATTHGALLPLTPPLPGSERFVVCDNSLYWTSSDQHGWTLNSFEQGQIRQLLKGIVNVECGPDQSLLLQQQDSAFVKQWSHEKAVTLPVQINWRSTPAAAWVSTDEGLYWLSDDGKVLNLYDWKHQQQQQWPLSEAAQALMSGNGTLYVQQFRTQDTDIVWLHPEQAD